MSGKLDRRDEVRFIACLEANHYIPDNKKGSGSVWNTAVAVPL